MLVEPGGFADAWKLEAKGRHFSIERRSMDNFVVQQILDEHANEAYESALVILVLELLAMLDAVVDEELEEPIRDIHIGDEMIEHLQRVHCGFHLQKRRKKAVPARM
jgi:hypothetical protein